MRKDKSQYDIMTHIGVSKYGTGRPPIKRYDIIQA